MKSTDKQQFLFLPPEFSKESAVIHVSCYKLALIVLNRSTFPHIIVPIEKLGYLAVIEPNAIWFTHNLSQTIHDHQTGRMINLSWHPHIAESRNELDQHIPMDIIFYGENRSDIQQQLTGEFYKALMLLDEKYKEKIIPTEAMKIIDLDH